MTSVQNNTVNLRQSSFPIFPPPPPTSTREGCKRGHQLTNPTDLPPPHPTPHKPLQELTLTLYRMPKQCHKQPCQLCLKLRGTHSHSPIRTILLKISGRIMHCHRHAHQHISENSESNENGGIKHLPQNEQNKGYPASEHGPYVKHAI